MAHTLSGEGPQRVAGYNSSDKRVAAICVPVLTAEITLELSKYWEGEAE